LKKLTEQEKHQQILKEIKATFLLFLIVAVWHCAFAFGLNGKDLYILGMPAWFVVSTFGAFIISVAGVIYLLKRVFVDFEFSDEEDEEGGTRA